MIDELGSQIGLTAQYEIDERVQRSNAGNNFVVGWSSIEQLLLMELMRLMVPKFVKER